MKSSGNAVGVVFKQELKNEENETEGQGVKSRECLDLRRKRGEL